MIFAPAPGFAVLRALAIVADFLRPGSRRGELQAQLAAGGHGGGAADVDLQRAGARDRVVLGDASGRRRS